MKYTLSINQFAVVSIGLADKVDLIDLCIFDAFKSFANSSRCEKMVDEGGIWFWISYAEIIGEIPLSGIKTNDGIYRRMKKLAEAGIIIFHPNNQRLSRTFFKWGANYDAIERRQNTSTPTDEKPEVPKYLRMKNRRGTDEKPEVPTDETPNNHYTINHTTNHIEVVSEKKSLTTPAHKNENFEEKSEEGKIPPPSAAAPPPLIVIPDNLNTPEFLTAWNDLASTKKWKKKEPTCLNSTLRQLAKYDVWFAIQLCENATSGNYQGVVFGDTPEKYAKWLKLKNDQNGTSTYQAQRAERERSIITAAYEHFSQGGRG